MIGRLVAACECGDVAAIRTLFANQSPEKIRHAVNQEYEGSVGEGTATPLHFASWCNAVDVVLLLLALGADVNQGTVQYNDTALGSVSFYTRTRTRTITLTLTLAHTTAYVPISHIGRIQRQCQSGRGLVSRWGRGRR